MFVPWEDRITSYFFDTYNLGSGPHAETERISRVISAGKRAIITHCYIFMGRYAPASTGVGHYTTITLNGADLNSGVLLRLETEYNEDENPLFAQLSSPLFLEEGDTIRAFTLDDSIVGGVRYTGAVRGYEFV